MHKSCIAWDVQYSTEYTIATHTQWSLRAKSFFLLFNHINYLPSTARARKYTAHQAQAQAHNPTTFLPIKCTFFVVCTSDKSMACLFLVAAKVGRRKNCYEFDSYYDESSIAVHITFIFILLVFFQKLSIGWFILNNNIFWQSGCWTVGLYEYRA